MFWETYFQEHLQKTTADSHLSGLFTANTMIFVVYIDVLVYISSIRVKLSSKILIMCLRLFKERIPVTLI